MQQVAVRWQSIKPLMKIYSMLCRCNCWKAKPIPWELLNSLWLSNLSSSLMLGSLFNPFNQSFKSLWLLSDSTKIREVVNNLKVYVERHCRQKIVHWWKALQTTAEWKCQHLAQWKKAKNADKFQKLGLKNLQ